ncbi:MAG: hypothetical protein COV66_00100 [Nitrospinae bacterium CG11_big_fil_rev_8_21_14_0_20_45_15]|nr:MAG: hypothetical protein COV66_00100 [Nitrospinae bacterium CG11_big_fil_rev_8_21_14_0_20_45_15]
MSKENTIGILNFTPLLFQISFRYNMGMINFTYIKYGVALALISILLGISLGLGFGCCEDTIVDKFKKDSTEVLDTVYDGSQKKANRVVNKSWNYMIRAHLHSQTMGVISLVFSLLVAGLKFAPRWQLGISIFSGLGALGYGTFWLLAGFLAPRMGSTSASKNAIELLAQGSAGCFFVSAIVLFALLGMRMFAFQNTAPE